MSSSGYPTVSGAAPRGGDFRERADRGRAAEGWLGLVLSVIALAVGVSCLTGSKVPLGVMLVLGGLGSAWHGAGRISLSRRIPQSSRYWSQGAGCIQFGPSRCVGLRYYLPAAMASLGALVAVWLQAFSGMAFPGGAWTLELAVLVLFGSLLGCATVPIGGRGAPEIILTPQAVWIWTGGRRHVHIPWGARPSLEARIIHRLRPHALITGSAARPVRFPIFLLPIGYSQLQTVLGFYTAHAELRGELATDQGLQRVRTLMSAPAPSAYPVSSYGLVPHQGAPYTTASGTTSRPWPVAPEAMASLAAGHSGAIPQPYETARTRDGAEDFSKDEEQAPWDMRSCEEGDRALRRAPWQFLVWAIIVLVFSTYVTDSRQSGAFLLGLVVSLVLLIHAVALAGARRCRTIAYRRWTRSDEGICLTGTWFVLLIRHVEVALMALGCLLSVGLLVIRDRAYGGGVVVPFLIAMVLLVTAGLLGLSTPLPRRGAEIILDPERIRIAVGTSRESPFWWKDRPRIVGGGPSGAVLVEIHPVGRVRARLNTLPLTHAQLQRVVEFYSSHPEARAELASEQGLVRVQALMRGPF